MAARHPEARTPGATPSRPGSHSAGSAGAGNAGAGSADAGNAGADGSAAKGAQAEDETEARTTEREIIVSRVLSAPRELVFKAWTDPRHVGNWWGPQGFTTTIRSMDVRPGGEWIFMMHGPNGTDYRNEISYVDVAPPERLVYDHGPAPKFRTTVTFEKQGDRRTKVTMVAVFGTAEELRKTIENFHAFEGAKQHIGRLAEYVVTM